MRGKRAERKTISERAVDLERSTNLEALKTALVATLAADDAPLFTTVAIDEAAELATELAEDAPELAKDEALDALDETCDDADVAEAPAAELATVDDAGLRSAISLG